MPRDTDKFSFSIRDRHPLYKGFYAVDKIEISHQRFDGGELVIQRELIARYNAACVLLVDPQRSSVVLIEQFRVGAIGRGNPWLLEVVAGMIDKDEPPEAVARREAMEEAGVTVARLCPIRRYFPSPGASSEQVFLFAGEVDSSTAKGVHGLDEEGEDIRVHTFSFDEAFSLLEENRIENAATIISLQWLQVNKDRLAAIWP